MPGQAMDFLEALASLLNHGVEVDRCITSLQRARQSSKYTLVTRFGSYAITYTKQGWTIELN